MLEKEICILTDFNRKINLVKGKKKLLSINALHRMPSIDKPIKTNLWINVEKYKNRKCSMIEIGKKRRGGIINKLN